MTKLGYVVNVEDGTAEVRVGAERSPGRRRSGLAEVGARRRVRMARGTGAYVGERVETVEIAPTPVLPTSLVSFIMPAGRLRVLVSAGPSAGNSHERGY